MQKPQLDPQSIKAIESALAKGDRAEAVPLKNVVMVKGESDISNGI